VSADRNDRAAFADRIRLQLTSRYHHARVEVDNERFSLHVTGDGLDATLPLAPLHQAVSRNPAQTPTLIARFVSAAENQLTPRVYGRFSTAHILWCVRSTAYMKGIARASELLLREMPGDLVAFAAEELPGPSLRGVPRAEWTDAGVDDDTVINAVETHTAARFQRLIERIRRSDRVPADGWRMAGDPMFQGSVLLVPTVLSALVERAGGDVLLAVPDRGVVLALPASAASAQRFDRRVLREWREAMDPCSHEIVETDGTVLRSHDGGGRRGWVMPWLSQPVGEGGSADLDG
jgi:hypothetical protein